MITEKAKQLEHINKKYIYKIQMTQQHRPFSARIIKHIRKNTYSFSSLINSKNKNMKLCLAEHILPESIKQRKHRCDASLFSTIIYSSYALQNGKNDQLIIMLISIVLLATTLHKIMNIINSTSLRSFTYSF